MPNFTYKCLDCAEETVHNVRIDERDSRTDLECEVCRGTNLKRALDNPRNKIEGGRMKGRIHNW
jgi:hypothetical protein